MFSSGAIISEEKTSTAQEGRSFSEQPFLAPVANSWAWTSSRGILLFPWWKGYVYTIGMNDAAQLPDRKVVT
ncbi:hypothetical protein I7I50_06670 [Histoplasma capsulatum G186AR]|uniref:Uncharacterized protein n=1 Tax=Ajellomyces capsulatus TaxID=5037 RepID=A0A8H7Z252_AJECA|nr:hypothetical protein I7I52_10256 [Histoplasma capsulatum]QSS67553.1 hypothetical protein I7I50_06670 [Histoplasma capsulatum G186AR]